MLNKLISLQKKVRNGKIATDKRRVNLLRGQEPQEKEKKTQKRLRLFFRVSDQQRTCSWTYIHISPGFHSILSDLREEKTHPEKKSKGFYTQPFPLLGVSNFNSRFINSNPFLFPATHSHTLFLYFQFVWF